MKKIVYLILLITVTLAFAACQSNNQVSKNTDSPTTASPNPTSPKLHLISTTIPAPSLKSNLVNEPTEKPIVIYLPPSYYDTDKSYPVVYYLHGFGGNCYEVSTFQEVADKVMKSGAIKDFILVGVTGQNNLGGSFYVNSPVTGLWEDYAVKDVIEYIDSNYRTIKKAEARGIAGFSMGGFGSINLALKHPDIYSTVYAVCPGLLDDNDINEAFNSWDSTFLDAYGAAFSPNTALKHPYANIPKFDKSAADNEIIANWKNGFGNLKGKIQNYLKNPKKLSAIRIEYGTNDTYTWIPKGCQYFSKLLNENKIQHELKSFDGGHDYSYSIIEESILPFFSEHLSNQ